MEEKVILEGNKIIAEFMGLEEMNGFMTSCSGIEVSVKGYEYNNTFYPLNELGYNTSWDWLMPVLNKISELNYQIFMEIEPQEHLSTCRISRASDGYVIHEDYLDPHIILKSFIEIVWFECVIFLFIYQRG